MLTGLLGLFGVTAAVAAGAIALPGTASAFCDNAQCVPNVAAHMNGTPSDPCADWLSTRQGIAASYDPTNGQVGVHRPVEAQISVPPAESSPYAKYLFGAHGQPATTLRDMGGELRWAHRPDVPG